MFYTIKAKSIDQENSTEMWPRDSKLLYRSTRRCAAPLRSSYFFLLYELKVETCSKFYSTLEFNSQHRNLPVKRYFLHSVDTSTISIKCFFLLVNNKLRLQQLNLLTVVKNYIVKLMRISVKRKVYTCSDVIKYFFFPSWFEVASALKKILWYFCEKKTFFIIVLESQFQFIRGEL